MKEFLIYILILIFSTFVFVAIIAFSKWHEYSQEKRLRDLVSWCVVKEKPGELLTHAHDLPLWAYVSNAQIKIKIPNEHCVVGDEEWSFAKDILEEYKNDLTQSYFKGYLRMIKSKYVIQHEAYFMLTLYIFLSDHQCDSKLLGHDMHKERLEYTRYSDWGGPCYDAIYSLTTFAIVFHKMHYIAYMYCRGNEMLRDFVPEWNEKNLKEILDTKQIQVSRF